MSYILGDSIGFTETLEIEFKEFMLKIDPKLYYSTEEIHQIVNSNIINQTKFNSMICDNIYHYFKYYIPKYLSVFGNSKLESAELYFGINDYGEITGIPFFGDLSLSNTDLLSSVLPFIKIDNIDISKFISKISIEIINIKKDITFLDDNVSNIIDEFNLKKKNYETEYFHNLAERNKWKEQVDYYMTSIRDYMVKPCYRKEVADYVKLSSDMHAHVISLLESDELIEFTDYNDIDTRKLNQDDVMYWITEFKQNTIQKLRLVRPQRIPYMCFSQNIYSSQLSLLSNLRYRFCNNPDINFYMIRITIPTDIVGSVYYKLESNDTWYQRTRTFVNGLPGCIQI
jgi:hypothetical protein